MDAGVAERLAEWVARLSYEDIPERVRERARLQAASVLGAICAGSRASFHAALRRASPRWGAGADATVIPTGARAPLHTACYLNAAASIAFDYDDYLFAGHTGHSAVVASLALGEAVDAHGREVLTAQVAANEAAGRLGAAMLLGPHNGQMWTYVHALAGAVIGGRFLGPDERAITNAIGIALAAPPYPLAPGFFGPDSKMLLAAEPLVAGLRAADLASEGLTGARDPIGGTGGMLEKIATKPLSFLFDGLGSAWVTESLAYKVVPGCAYVHTPVEAFEEIRESFARKHGRALVPGDVERIRVEATLFTDGMERMSEPHRVEGTLRATDVNFSAKLTLGVIVSCGELSPDTLSDRSLADHFDAIMRVAARTDVAATEEMNARLSSLRDVGIDTLRLFDPDYRPSLEGADFSRFEMRFPARVTLETTAGEEYQAECDAPRGAPGRPWTETVLAVGGKFRREARAAGISDPERALQAVSTLDKHPARALVTACTGRG